MTRYRTAIRILIEALREIFDESSYKRFLHRNGLSSSRESYQQFWREREHSHSRRPRCC